MHFVKLQMLLVNAFNVMLLIIDNKNLMEILMDSVYAMMVIMMMAKINFASSVKNFGF